MTSNENTAGKFYLSQRLSWVPFKREPYEGFRLFSWEKNPEDDHDPLIAVFQSWAISPIHPKWMCHIGTVSLVITSDAEQANEPEDQSKRELKANE